MARAGRRMILLSPEFILIDPVLRPLKKSDFAPLADLWQRAWAAVVVGDDEAWTARCVFEARLLAPGGLDTLTAIVAEVEDGVAGFALMDTATARLIDLAVDPARMRQGLGRCLAAAATKLAGGHLRLEAPVATAGFWDRLGFRRLNEGAMIVFETD
jgi:GNAT superfamily N-acetyltransferase